jgi:hypothetical protein
MTTTAGQKGTVSHRAAKPARFLFVTHVPCESMTPGKAPENRINEKGGVSGQLKPDWGGFAILCVTHDTHPPSHASSSRISKTRKITPQPEVSLARAICLPSATIPHGVTGLP